MITNLYSSIITYLPSVSGRRTDSWRMHSPEWQNSLASFQPIQTLGGKSGRKHDTGIHPQIGSHGTSRAYGYPYIHRIQGTRHSLRTAGTSGKTAVSAIQTLRLPARTYYNYTFSLQNVVRITEKELHTMLFNHSDHLFRQLLNVFTRNQRSFNHINTFPFGAVRAAVSICLATSSTCSWRQSRSFCIIVFLS